MLGGPLGSTVGGGIGSIINKVFGKGDYSVNSNTLLGSPVPQFSIDGSDLTVSHREYLQDVQGTTAFVIDSFSLNPGINSTFPWLSAVAANFEQYEFLGLLFEYRPMSGTAVGSTNTALGTVVMATEYDASKPVFASKQQMESYKFSNSCVPYDKMVHPVECKPSEKTVSVQYVRTGPIDSTQDIQFYDLGNFQIATQGMQSGVSTIGELWVSYHVRFKMPRIPFLGSGALYSHITEGGIGTATGAAPLGTTGGVISQLSNLNSEGSYSASTNSFVLPHVGNFMIFGSWAGTSIGAAPVYTVGSNIIGLNLLIDDTEPSIFGTTSTTSALGTLCVQVKAAGVAAANSVVITGLTAMVAGAADIWIFQVPMPAAGASTVNDGI
jgi:hypothetical protein